jgi:hypothetical protein
MESRTSALNCAIRGRRLFMVIACVVWWAAMALCLRAEPPKYARPPKFSPEVQKVFSDDPRKELQGERPDYERLQSGAAASATAAGGPAGAGFAWSKLIASDTLESEIKRLSSQLDKDITTPTAFKAGGNKLCRRDFSLLAALFAVAGQYDGDARWKEFAPGLRDQFAKAGYNSKAASDGSYNEARERKQQLAELIRGDRPQTPQGEASATWAHVSDRPPLMQRLNIAQQERLTKWTADATAFKKNQSDVRHEAQLVATIAEIITREGFDYTDDAQYIGFAHDLRQAASDADAAAAKGEYDAARQAVNRAGKACTACHEAFRG